MIVTLWEIKGTPESSYIRYMCFQIIFSPIHGMNKPTKVYRHIKNTIAGMFGELRIDHYELE